MTYKYKCPKCYKSFKKEGALAEHLDYHTPFWKGKKITLSGADQIRLMIKKCSGGWKQMIDDEKKRAKQKGTHDLEKAIILKEFEQKNKIRFIINNDKVESFMEIA